MNFPDIKTEQDFNAHFQSEAWFDAAKQICLRHNIFPDEIKRAGGTDHIVFLLGDYLVLKIYRPFRNCFERETKALEFVSGKTEIKTPEIVHSGAFEHFPYVLTTQISGKPFTRNDWLKITEKTQVDFISKLAVGLKQIHELDAEPFKEDWAAFVKNRAETFIERQIVHGVNEKIIEVLPEFIEENLKFIPTDERAVFMHADIHFGNLRVTNKNENLQISGLFDFADSRCGFYEYDFLAVGVLMIQGQSKLQREFFKAYGYAEKDLDEQMRKRLMMLTMIYETADLRRYAMRLKPEAVDYSLDELEKGIWSFLE